MSPTLPFLTALLALSVAVSGASAEPVTVPLPVDPYAAVCRTATCGGPATPPLETCEELSMPGPCDGGQPFHFCAECGQSTYEPPKHLWIGTVVAFRPHSFTGLWNCVAVYRTMDECDKGVDQLVADNKAVGYTRVKVRACIEADEP